MQFERDIDLIVDRSEHAVNLCNHLLEPAAEYFAPGGVFAMSEMPEVRAASMPNLEDSKLQMSFTAYKLERPEELDDGEESLVSFSVSMRVSAPYQSSVYWPGLSGNKLAPGDEIIDEHRTAELAKAHPSILSRAVIAVVWDYFIDNEYYEPRKQIRWEYYADANDDMPIAIVNAHNPEAINNMSLSEDDEQDKVLREMDIELTETFNENDLMVIAHILNCLGYETPYFKTPATTDRE